MKRIFTHAILVAATGLSSLSVRSQSAESTDELIPIVKKELEREMSAFKSVNPPPYYLAYRVLDRYSGMVSASFGSITEANQNHRRMLKTAVRIGDYKYDNTHVNDDAMFGGGFMNFYSGLGTLPLENNAAAIRHELWEVTQQAYQSALKAYQALKDVSDAKLTPGGDFSQEPPQTFIDSPLPDFATIYNHDEWQERVRQLTTSFLQDPAIVDGTAHLAVSMERSYLVSTEGTVIAQNRFSTYLYITGAIRTADGDIAPLHLSYFAFKPSGIPPTEQILGDVATMVKKLILLKSAPRAEPYTGPAILNSRAAAVFFHEIFGHRIEGHRFRDKMDAQTFKGMLGTEVLPKNLSVTSDPTLQKFEGTELNGSYQYDDEGVKGQKVTIVENGILKTFLMSRSPVDQLTHSNGHGRGEASISPVSRQSNLIVTNSKPVTMKDLRKMLIAECKKQKKPYGYLFMDVMGGFTMTNRYMPNAFNIFPTEVYRVYTDGRPDELVHGVNLIGTPLSMFAEIKGADNASDVFTGFCGAESGSVPVTAISPSILVNRIETQKKIQTEIEHAILPLPGPND